MRNLRKHFCIYFVGVQTLCYLELFSFAFQFLLIIIPYVVIDISKVLHSGD